MSPEIVMGENFDLPTDVYSLGIIFIEILTRIVVGAKVYSRQAPHFTPDPDEVRRRASPGCPPEFIDLALQCCSFAPEERPALPDILVRLRAIEISLPEEPIAEILCSSNAVRRDGKRALPLFDAASDSEVFMEQVDEQLAGGDDTEEEQVYQALAGADIIIDGHGPSMVFTTSSGPNTAPDKSEDVFHSSSSDSEMASECHIVTELTVTARGLLISTGRIGQSATPSSSVAIRTQMPCTYPEEGETSSTRTVKGVSGSPPRRPSVQTSFGEVQPVAPTRLRRSRTMPNSRRTLSHRFSSTAEPGATQVLQTRRIPSSCRCITAMLSFSLHRSCSQPCPSSSPSDPSSREGEVHGLLETH